MWGFNIMIKRDGEFIENELCYRVKSLGQLCTDSSIINLLRSMDEFEILELVTLGRVSKWRNEKKDGKNESASIQR